jgi:hypothetical protein
LVFSTLTAADAAPPSFNSPARVGAPNAQRIAAAGPTLGGCRMFPPDNAWNVPIDTVNVRPNSAQIIANIQAQGNTVLHADFTSPVYGYGMPFRVVPQNQPLVPITYDQYPQESDPGPFPIPVDFVPEQPYDQHVLVLQQGTCMLYELWAAHRCGSGWCAGTGAKWNLASNATRTLNWTSADAAGLPILAGLARCDEMLKGRIDHALRMTLGRTNSAFVLPATHGPSAIHDANFAAMGMRFRLKASFDISGYTGQAKVFLQAFKKYGLMVADNGVNWYFQGERNGSCWDDQNLRTLMNVPGTAFEVVDTGKVYPWPYRG